MEGKSIRCFEAKCGIIGLDPATPDLIIRADERLGMGVNWQDETLTRMFTCIVVRLGGTSVADQETILIGEMLDPVFSGRIIQETEIVGSSLQAQIIPTVLAKFPHIVMGSERGFGTRGSAKAIKGPARICFCTVGWVAGDIDRIHHKTRRRHIGICPIAESHQHIARESGKISRQINPVSTAPTGYPFTKVLSVRAGVGREIGVHIGPVGATICRERPPDKRNPNPVQCRNSPWRSR